MPLLTKVGGNRAVYINAAGQLVAEQGYEVGPVTTPTTKWITLADVMGLLGGGDTPFIRWSAGQCIVAPVDNPQDSPACYQQRIYIPAPFRLDRYQYGLRSPGLATDGALWLSAWSEVAGALGTVYTDSRSVATHGDKPAGLSEAWCGDLVEFGDLKTVDLPQGWMRLLIVVDTSSPFGITKPHIDYWDAGAVQCVGRGGVAVVTGHGGFAEATDYNDVTPGRYSPCVYLGGTFL